MKWLKINNSFVTGYYIECRIRTVRSLFIGFLMLLPLSGYSQLNKQKPKNLQDVGIDEHLGRKIPLDLRFATSAGDSVTLGQLFTDGKPVLLNPVYYNCPMLCSMVTEAVYSGIRELKWDPGKDYTIITFSIDPDEKTPLADSTRQEYLGKLDRKGAEEGWHFLTGKEEAIRPLTEAVGFRYEKVERTGEYAHSASVMFLSPAGTITRYLYGIKFTAFNIRNALYEAADGKIGNTVDKIVMYCYQYDPDSGSYVAVAWRIMQLGGLVTFLILGIFLGFLWLKEKDSKNDSNLKDRNGSI